MFVLALQTFWAKKPLYKSSADLHPRQGNLLVQCMLVERQLVQRQLVQRQLGEFKVVKRQVGIRQLVS
jgi:hypothetical protein